MNCPSCKVGELVEILGYPEAGQMFEKILVCVKCRFKTWPDALLNAKCFVIAKCEECPLTISYSNEKDRKSQMNAHAKKLEHFAWVIVKQ